MCIRKTPRCTIRFHIFNIMLAIRKSYSMQVLISRKKEKPEGLPVLSYHLFFMHITVSEFDIKKVEFYGTIMLYPPGGIAQPPRPICTAPLILEDRSVISCQAPHPPHSFRIQHPLVCCHSVHEGHWRS